MKSWKSKLRNMNGSVCVNRYVMYAVTVLLTSLLYVGSTFAQTDSVRWSLTANVSANAFGNLVGSDETFSNLVVRSYNGGVCQKSAPTSAGDWVADVGEVASRYEQFAVSPASGYNFIVSSVRFFIGWSGTTNHIFANVYCSTDPTFATRTQLGGTITLVQTYALYSFPLNVNVPDGSTFYIRVYPWNNAVATGKSCGLFDLAVLGATSGGSNPSLSVNPGSLSFGTIALNTTQDFSYALSGLNLSPSSGSIAVNAPTGFSVSTTSGSGYSSSISVPYSGGTLSSTTIYTRFTPTSAITYSGNVTNSGGSAVSQNVSVTGTGTSNIAGIFVSLGGSDANPGSYDQPFLTIPKALSVAQPGDTIFVRSGRYMLSSTINISTSGTSAHRYCLYGYPGDATRPVLDFSSMAMSSSNRGINLSGQYWHIKGLEIYKAGDNGINISGSNNIVEFCALYENRDSGMQLGGGASFNQILNCDSYFNYDSTGDPATAGGNADGFSPKLDVGTGNYFYGCRSWQNSDDGWDGYLRPATGVTTTLENCWSFRNGFLKDGVTTYASMNGNGFKMGGGDKVGSVSNGDSLRHNMILKNCVTFDCKAKGFDQNNNRGSMTMYNCTGYRSGTYNFSVPGFICVGESLSIKNCISLASLGVTLSGVPNPILATNSWPNAPPYTSIASSADFTSIDTAGVRGPRKADGSLPDVNFMHLALGSQFIDAGTNVGIPYVGSAPDLGAFESSYGSTPTYTLTITAVNGVVVKNPDQANYNSGTSVQLTANPSTGYHFTGWSGDLTGSTNPVTVAMNANKNITANFAVNTYTITASAGANGTISPSGVTTVNYGNSQSYSIAGSSGYHVSDVLVDGSTVGAVTSYTFTNVTANHTINASFSADTSSGQTSIALSPGWNLISVPRVTLNDSANVLFPNKSGSMFAYSTDTKSYQSVTTLSCGLGYWVNNAITSTVTVGGGAPGNLTVTVAQAGWVTVGSRERAVDVSGLVFSNGSTQAGSAFRYNAAAKSYQATTVINPGEAIWINMTAPCVITIP